MSVCNAPDVNVRKDCKILVGNDSSLATIPSSIVEVRNTSQDMTDTCLQLLSEPSKPTIFVPENMVGLLLAAGVLDKYHWCRIVPYYEKAADMQRAIETSSQSINRKIQKRCLTRDLRSILDGAEIDSILYKDGPVDASALIDRLNEIEQRNKRKQSNAISTSTNTSLISNTNQRYWHYAQLPPTPTGVSPRGDYPIDELI